MKFEFIIYFMKLFYGFSNKFTLNLHNVFEFIIFYLHPSHAPLIIDFICYGFKSIHS